MKIKSLAQKRKLEAHKFSFEWKLIPVNDAEKALLKEFVNLSGPQQEESRMHLLLKNQLKSRGYNLTLLSAINEDTFYIEAVDV